MFELNTNAIIKQTENNLLTYDFKSATLGVKKSHFRHAKVPLYDRQMLS